MFRRYATTLIFALWMGGFTFYAEIVIPTATHVLRNGRHAGFITQQVTYWLNWIGVAALGVFFWNWMAERCGQTQTRRRILAATWMVMVIAHVGLFLTHSRLDHTLDTNAQRILDADPFDTLHTIYLTFATAQWIAALVYLWCSFRSWQHDDRLSNAPQAKEA